MTNWTLADQAMAQIDGWGLFEPDGHEDRLQLQKLDAAGRLPSDEAAWLYVFDRAVAGDDLAVKGLETVERTNPDEFASIGRYIGIMRSWQLAEWRGAP